MGWTTVVGTTASGGVLTTMTLELPGLAQGPVVTLNKTTPSESLSVGQSLTRFKRTAAGETWHAGFPGGDLSRSAGYIVETASGSGSPTVAARAQPWRQVPSIALLNEGSKNLFWARTDKVTKPGAETWTYTGYIYGYIDAMGATLYTNSPSTAAAAGLLRWVHGQFLQIDPSDATQAHVGVWWTPLWIDSAPAIQQLTGSDIEPTLAIGVSAALFDRIFSNTERTVFATGLPTSVAPIFIGYAASITGTGASTLVGLNSALVPTARDDVLALAVMPGWKVLTYAGASTYSTTWTWTTGATLVGSAIKYDELQVKIPSFLTAAGGSFSGPVGRVPDIAIDVTLPAPVGDARIIWSYANGYFVPGLFQRTTGSAPFSGAVRAAGVRRPDTYCPLSAAGRIVMQYLTPHDPAPYAFGVLSEFQEHTHIGRESLPTTAPDIDQVFSSASPIVSAEAVWQYWDNSASPPAWVDSTARTALTIAFVSGSIYRLTGTPTAPSCPSDYPQGSWRLQVFVTHTVTVSTLGKEVYRGAAGQAKLPVYPWDVLKCWWVGSDADVTPVNSAGWYEAARLDVGTISWGGSLSVSYSAGNLTINGTSITPSGARTKMRGDWALTATPIGSINSNSRTQIRGGSDRRLGYASSTFPWVQDFQGSVPSDITATISLALNRPSAAPNAPVAAITHVVAQAPLALSNSGTGASAAAAQAVKVFEGSTTIP